MAVVSAILTFAIALLKGVVGYISGSIALMADALHSFSDVLGPIAVYIGLKFAQKDPNERFPYGYYRAETLASLAVSFLIFVTGIETLRESIERITNPTTISHPFAAVLALLISLAVVYYLYKYKEKVGREIHSQALMGEGQHSLVDFYTSIAALIAIISSYFGFTIIEPIVGAIISIAVILLGINLMKTDILMLMDFCDEEVVEEIRKTVLDVKGVEGVHNLKARKAGPFMFCEMHIEVDENLSFKEAHRISDDVVDKIRENIKNIDSITIHIDPIKMKKIRIAVPIESADKDRFKSKINKKFAFSPYFMFVDVSDGKITNSFIKENPAKNLEKKKGIETANFLIDNDVDVVIVKDIGMGSYNALRNKYARVVKTEENTVEEAINEFLECSKNNIDD
ncbi:cation diffusion facilitator family transporter [Methanotorris formicicus]|uniref:cation diffusion facilitator family transporter n=1 Tax=Methanotorris formicicus TaxID=213185 RepID=UPI001FE07657|nr:cation diffusion facilitator family transporter [Methanotorris formicicus]